MDFASSTASCRDIEDKYTVDLHEDDGLNLHVSTFVKNLTVVQSYSPNTKKTLFAVEVHVNQKKFWQAKVDLPGHEGEIAQLATLTTSFANDFSFEFNDMVTLEGSQSQLNNGRLHEFIVHGNNVREVFWDELYKYMTRSIHNIASNISSEKHVTKPSKVTVILEIGVARCVYVPYDHRGEKIMQRNLPCSFSHDDDEFEMDKKFEKDCMDDADCPICHYELMLMETNITRMPCNHLFHSKCLLKWLPKHNTCPLCRSPMWGPDGSVHGDVKEANGSIHGDVKE